MNEVAQVLWAGRYVLGAMVAVVFTFWAYDR